MVNQKRAKPHPQKMLLNYLKFTWLIKFQSEIFPFMYHPHEYKILLASSQHTQNTTTLITIVLQDCLNRFIGFLMLQLSPKKQSEIMINKVLNEGRILFFLFKNQ